MNVKTGHVLARPFPKFFNYDEHVNAGGQVPVAKPDVYDKLDGSLGILYKLGDSWMIATRGSFTSDQAQWATKWLNENVALYNPGEHYTHLFEIVYPENRIVVNYDFSGLVHLSTRRTDDGTEIDFTWEGTPIRAVKKHTFTSVEELVSRDAKNEEGYVLHWPDESLRLKVKFAEYVRLHKIVTGLSVKGVWEHLREKGIDSDAKDIVEDVPDEFFDWLNETIEMLQKEYYSILDTAHLEFSSIVYSVPESAPRAEWASRIVKMTHPALGFALLDKKSINDAIFRMIKPKGANTFKQDEI